MNKAEDSSISRIDVAATIIEFEIKRGHLKWSVLEIAKVAKMSRSLIYYHFGRTKQDILHNSLNELLEEFYGLSPARAKSSLSESLKLTQQIYHAYPSLAIFFQKWRKTESQIAEMLLECEKKYEAKLKKAFPKADADQVKAIHAIFHGLVTAPYLKSNTIPTALQLLQLEKLR